MKNGQRLVTSILGTLLLGTGLFGLTITTQAQEEVIAENPSVQDQALNAVAKMTEGQRTYYQNDKKFQDQVDVMVKDFGISEASEYDYAIRTTTEAAYNYAIPTSNSYKGYVGAAFLALDGSGEITTIICENENPGLERPADPQLVRDPLDTNKISLQCGEQSVEVPASRITK